MQTQSNPFDGASDHFVEPQEYRLGSSPMIYAPGIVAWAINGYKFKRDQDQMIEVVSKGWNIPRSVARALLSGTSKYTIDGEAVVFKA